MPTPLSTTQLYAFSAPVVKGSDLVLPVTLGVEVRHGLRASIAHWRVAATDILAATEPKALQVARANQTRRPTALAAAPTLPGAPIPKPSGRIL